MVKEEEYINPTGKIRTTVKANGVASSADKAVEVTAKDAKTGITVVDTIHYEGLVAGKKYSVTGELYEVSGGQKVGEAKATATKEFTATQATGDWELEFGKVTGLEAGKIYVVYETASSEENLVDSNKDNQPDKKHELTHKDPNDKAQTVVVKEDIPNVKEVYFSKVNLGGEEIAGAKIEIKQDDTVITKWISKAGETHLLKLPVGEYIFHEESAPEGYLAVTDITFTVNEDGTVTVKDTNGNQVKAEGNKLIVTDKNKPNNPNKPNTPKMDFPNTGDTTGVFGMVGGALLSFGALLSLIFKKKRY